MGPALRVSFLGLLLVSLFLQFESSRATQMNPSVPNYCDDNLGGCLKACPRGWMFYKDNCYGVFEDALTWSKSEVQCQAKKRKAHLASFMNKEELDKIVDYLTAARISDHVWIGLYDPRRTRNWVWADLSVSGYFPWDTGEPNNANNDEYCTHLASHTGYRKLNDAPCSLELSYICKYPL